MGIWQGKIWQSTPRGPVIWQIWRGGTSEERALDRRAKPYTSGLLCASRPFWFEVTWSRAVHQVALAHSRTRPGLVRVGGTSPATTLKLVLSWRIDRLSARYIALAWYGMTFST